MKESYSCFRGLLVILAFGLGMTAIFLIVNHPWSRATDTVKPAEPILTEVSIVDYGKTQQLYRGEIMRDKAAVLNGPKAIVFVRVLVMDKEFVGIPVSLWDQGNPPRTSLEEDREIGGREIYFQALVGGRLARPEELSFSSNTEELSSAGRQIVNPKPKK